ncbi:hypothetical protein [Qiania dongpingensis]|uniref:DUF8052 domain-containing protein n=1 Tax=Qiania dongpingensis TaxID=2763669 RepID=A0A7G9G542_9FIRM|nr:hypothetical protein [Qiania dongpingensis]QNM05924.1 hypothetical protein H9Q78_01760 [Qiania dongpingensis]
MMKDDEFTRRLRSYYEANYNLAEDHTIGNMSYDLYAAFSMSNSRYVLVRRAELWRSECKEHVFFIRREHISPELISAFREQLVSHIEPDLVREGNACPPKDHMYTYVTVIFIEECGFSEEAKKALRHLKFHKNYRLAIRGFCQLRTVGFDLSAKKVYGNPAARDLVKEYKKIFK